MSAQRPVDPALPQIRRNRIRESNAAHTRRATIPALTIIKPNAPDPLRIPTEDSQREIARMKPNRTIVDARRWSNEREDWAASGASEAKWDYLAGSGVPHFSLNKKSFFTKSQCRLFMYRSGRTVRR